jgi:hypothetical protein
MACSQDAISARATRAGVWAEWEYDPADVVRVNFKVEVYSGPEAGQPPDDLEDALSGANGG